jgi:nicotinate-nucleotide adenylyltransferase
VGGLGHAMQRIGIFGGTFDPPHIGHLILAAEAIDQLNLDLLLWMLTPNPPHKRKQKITPVESRLLLVEAAIRDNPYCQISQVEMNRPGPHFSVDTMRLLDGEYPGAKLFFLIGGDSLRDLPIWYRPLDLINLVDGIGVMRRPQDTVDLNALEAQLPGISQKILPIHTPLIDISSSDIRQRIKENKPFRYFLPSLVYEIIEKNKLYR